MDPVKILHKVQLEKQKYYRPYSPSVIEIGVLSAVNNWRFTLVSILASHFMKFT